MPNANEMFADASGNVAERLESYKDSLNKAISRHDSGADRFAPGERRIVKGAGLAAKTNPEAVVSRVAEMTKGLSADDQAKIAAELESLKAVTADVQKDWAVTFPDSAGLVPYDLEAPAKQLVPRFTPLRNELSRTPGQGTARQFKVIDGYTNTGMGGVADQSPFMNSESITSKWGVPPNTPGSQNLTLNRPNKISYAAHDSSVAYVEMGLSDQVGWKAQFSGLGFENIRQLSQTALLWGHLLGEEKAMLYGRGAGTGYAGAVAAPGSVTGAASTTGGSLATASYFVSLTSVAGFGESVLTASSSVSVTGPTGSISITAPTGVTGALSFNVYVGSSATRTSQFLVGNVVPGGAFVVGTAPGTGANPPAANTTADANGYDGFLTALSDPTKAGYFKVLGSTLPSGATTPVDGPFQDAFSAMYSKNYADPDEIMFAPAIRRELGDNLRSTGTTAYRITLDNASVTGGTTLGAQVASVVNETTGKMVDLATHPYMPKGCAMIRSKTLPIPDSNIGATSQVICVQDYMSVDWPMLQMSYDASTYWFGTLIHYAPAWNGLIVGIQ